MGWNEFVTAEHKFDLQVEMAATLQMPSTTTIDSYVDAEYSEKYTSPYFTSG